MITFEYGRRGHIHWTLPPPPDPIVEMILDARYKNLFLSQLKIIATKNERKN